MSNTKTRLIVVGCLVLGVLAAAAGAQVVQSPPRQFFNTGLFSVATTDIAYIYVSIDDDRSGPAARVVLQFLDEDGAVVARYGADVLAGRSAALRTPGPGPLRAHIEVIENTLNLSARRRPVVGVEVIDTLTSNPRSIPTFNPIPVPIRPD